MSQVHRIIPLLLMAVLLSPLAVHAAVLEGFYQVAIPAREDLDRNQALREATELMITRQAGSQALDNPAVQAAMQEPQPLMRRIAGTEAGGVQVDFEPAALRDLLTEAGLVVLGPNRPTVMLWALENGTFGPELLSQGSPWSEVLTEAARRRAVALSLPLADLEDRTLVDVEAIAQADGEILRRASERYDAGAVLALSIGEAAGEPVLEWSWWLNEQTDKGRIQAESKAAAADQLMLEVANRVVQQYGVTPSSAVESSQWQLIVEGIDNVGEFASLQRTLQQLGSARSPRVLSIKGDQVTLALDFPGDEAQLERLLALDQRLRRIPEPERPVQAQPATEAEDLPAAGTAADMLEGTPSETAVPDTEQADRGADDTALETLEPMAGETAPPVPQPAANIMYFRWR